MERLRQALLALLMTTGAQAAPPQSADQSLAPWFQSLRVPGSPWSSCCDSADCRFHEVRIQNEHYEVLSEGEWLPVHESAILDRTDNPTGHWVACIPPVTFPRRVICFIRQPGL